MNITYRKFQSKSGSLRHMPHGGGGGTPSLLPSDFLSIVDIEYNQFAESEPGARNSKHSTHRKPCPRPRTRTPPPRFASPIFWPELRRIAGTFPRGAVLPFACTSKQCLEAAETAHDPKGCAQTLDGCAHVGSTDRVGAQETQSVDFSQWFTARHGEIRQPPGPYMAH